MFDYELLTEILKAVVQAIRAVPGSHNRPVETGAVLGVLLRADLEVLARGGQPVLDKMIEVINGYPDLLGAPALSATVMTAEEREMELTYVGVVGRA